MDPWSLDHSGLLMFHEAGTVWLHYGDGRPYRKLPGVTHHSEPRWSRQQAHVFYFIEGNRLMSFDVGKSWENDAVRVVHEFKEYATIGGKGEMDVSEDGWHIVLCGDDRHIFLYDIAADKSIAVPFSDDFESLYVTPDNNVIISGSTGQWISNPRTKTLRQLTAHDGHKAVCRDTDGSEIMVWTDNRDNGIWKYPLDGREPTLLFKPPWELAVHISCPDNLGWACVETYRTKPEAPITEYSNKILRVRLDGGGVEVLHDLPSDAVFPDSESQPRTAISHDGSRYIYDLDGDSFIGVLA